MNTIYESINNVLNGVELSESIPAKQLRNIKNDMKKGQSSINGGIGYLNSARSDLQHWGDEKSANQLADLIKKFEGVESDFDKFSKKIK